MKVASVSTLKRLGMMALMAFSLTAFVFLFLLPQATMASSRQNTDQTADTVIWQESFETDGINTRYTATEVCTDGGGDYFTRSDGTNIGSWIEFTGADGNYFYAAQDTDGTPDCMLATEVITFSTISIDGYSNLQFTGLFAEDDDGTKQDWDADGLVYIEYNIDGAGWTKFLQFASQGATNTEPGQDTNFDGIRDGDPLTSTFTNFTVDIAETGSSLELRLTTVNLDAGDEDIAFDNLQVVNIPPSFEIAKSAPSIVPPSKSFTYTIVVRNNTDITTTGTIITDTLPISTTFASASDGGTDMGGIVTWAIAGDFVAGATITRTFMVTATTTAGMSIFNLDYGVSASNWMTIAYGSPVETVTPYDNVCGATYVPVYSIQGSGGSSPIVGDDVSTEGIVTAVFQDVNQFNGFYIQDETGDGNVATSDGIFVYSSTPVTVTDAVRVGGTVDEYSGLTEITGVSSILVCGTGTITPTNISLPIATLDTWEQYEGMLLDFPQGLYATETYNLGRYGEVSLSINDRLYNPTSITTPGAAANEQQNLNDRSRVQLDDTYTNSNRDPIAYPGAGLTYTNTLRGGDYVANLTGVLDYAYGSYKIQPVGAVDFTQVNTRTVAPEGVSGNLTVASFNVLNYFTTIDDSGSICGPFSNKGCRGADTDEEFDHQRTKIINAIVAIDADIIGLMEIENNGYGAGSAIQDLVNGLNEATITGTYAFVDPGVPTIGADVIAVGLLYKPANVTLAGSSKILDSTVMATFNDLANRPVLAQSFTDGTSGKIVTIAVNHLKSKGSDCNYLGDPDMNDGQGNCNVTRESAAEALVSWLGINPTGSSSAYSLIIGDLNSYAMEDPITAITDAGYTNQLSEFSGLYAYSYVYSGQHGYLDHALSSAALTPWVRSATTWHINSDEPRAFDYNNYNLPYLYQPGAYRSSDHDPVVVGISLPTTTSYLPIIMK